MISVFTKETTPRIDYAFRLIFENILKDEVLFFSNADTFANDSSPVKINYSNEEANAHLNIAPEGLLSETDIHEIKIEETIIWDSLIGFFPIQNSSIPFDLFAAAFFLASRYEEYTPSAKRDIHGRFEASQSIAFQMKFLEIPIIDFWANNLALLIEQKTGYTFKRRSFKYLPSIDIDNAYAFLGKSFFRNIAATANDLLHRRWKNINSRIQVLCKKEKDPYDNYDFIEETLVQLGFKPTFFVLLNTYKKFDRGLSFKSKTLQNKIKDLYGKNFEIGIHPSYQSNQGKEQLNKEISRFESIVGKKPTQSRQHYLILNLPDTYRRLANAGISDDYSMGYASSPGFRAGTCSPFRFFDLKENKTTALTVHPFAVMDVTLRTYQKLDLEQSSKKIEKLMVNVAKIKGTFIGLWHNESLSDQAQWKGWRKIYVDMAQMAKRLEDR